MRVFIAINIPDSFKEKILLIQESLDKRFFRITSNDQLHITIAFLGEMPEYDTIIRKLEKVRFKKFFIKTKGEGFFPSDSKIRIVWIGLEENEEFMRLQHDIRKNFGFKEKLMPHITIARAKELIIDKEHKTKDSLKKEYDETEFLVDKFILFESVPGPKGHEHKILREFEGE